jgi:hypothetical protein
MEAKMADSGGEYDIDGGNTHRKTGVELDGIAWVSGQGGTRLTEVTETGFLLEVAGVTPALPDVGVPTPTDWLLV